MAKVVTLGEIMLRLSPPDHQRFPQAVNFDANYGGAEANVAFSLVQLGHEVTYVSRVPSNPIGDCAIQTLQKQGVNCSHIARGGKRLGIYFLENGASIRSPRVLYDRADSAIAEADPKDFNFHEIFQGVDLFHVSGITAVISEKAAALTLEAMKAAKQQGVCVSFDLNYRSGLWKDQVQEKQRIMAAMMEYVDICFGNALDAAKCLGYEDGDTDFYNSPYEVCVNAENMAKVVKRYGLTYLVTTLRNNISASDNGWSAAVSDGNSLYKGKEYQLHIIDRVGGGDAFAAGFLHGYLGRETMETALEYGIAAAAVKHTIPGDLNYISVSEIEALVYGDGAGRVMR
ncbi:MAG TPA: sugar kinase [Mobilitalea sp.]|nr:sugar kinase [Mobilitalea sp.]